MQNFLASFCRNVVYPEINLKIINVPLNFLQYNCWRVAFFWTNTINSTTAWCVEDNGMGRGYILVWKISGECAAEEQIIFSEIVISFKGYNENPKALSDHRILWFFYYLEKFSQQIS